MTAAVIIRPSSPVHVDSVSTNSCHSCTDLEEDEWYMHYQTTAELVLGQVVSPGPSSQCVTGQVPQVPVPGQMVPLAWVAWTARPPKGNINYTMKLRSKNT